MQRNPHRGPHAASPAWTSPLLSQQDAGQSSGAMDVSKFDGSHLIFACVDVSRFDVPSRQGMGPSCLNDAHAGRIWPAAYSFHADVGRRHPADAVLIIVVFEEHWVWVKHPQRGWELPGGKVEPGESPEAAAFREAFEECGARLAGLTWVAEYCYDSPQGPRYKWVYKADLQDAGSRPSSSEIVDVCVFRPIPDPALVHARPDMSPLVKDGVYEQLYWAWMNRMSHVPKG